MRIRKNAKVSPLLFTSHAPDAEELLPHVCQINRNPWDIIPFGPESDQWEVEESLYGGSFGDSIGAVESVASLRDGADEKPLEKNEGPVAEGIDIENNWKAGDERTGSMCCQQNDGRGWHCKKKAKQGESFCNHHLSLLRSNCIVKANGNGYCRDNGNNHNISSKKAAAAVSGAVQLKNGGGGGRKKVKKESAPNPYEFYYYSGFGPWRSRKRGGDKEKEETKAEGEIATATSFPPPHPHESAHRSPSSPIANGEFDYNDEDDEDDDDELDGSGVSSRKRMRKPVKERSLKSLM